LTSPAFSPEERARRARLSGFMGKLDRLDQFSKNYSAA